MVCGIVVSEGRVLVGRRGPGAHQPCTWEFPGGKVEAGESQGEALRREIAEETGLSFDEAALVHAEEHRYPDRTVRLSFFLCIGVRPPAAPGPAGGTWRWVGAEELRALEMPAANRRVAAIVADQIAAT